jgi:hypothetical protein
VSCALAAVDVQDLAGHERRRLEIEEPSDHVLDLPDSIASASARLVCCCIETMALSEQRPEASLVSAIADADSLRKRRASVVHEARYRKLSGWTRQPGGVDLALDGVAAGRVFMEMKVGKPEEALWDALKLGDILSVEEDANAYLIYAGTLRGWRDEVAGADLLLTGETWRALDLIVRWPQRGLICSWAGEAFGHAEESVQSRSPRSTGSILVTRWAIACRLRASRGSQRRCYRSTTTTGGQSGSHHRAVCAVACEEPIRASSGAGEP